MTDGPVMGKYMIQRDAADLGIPPERRIVRIDSLTGDPQAPYWATHVATLRHVIVSDDFEREATQEEADAAKKHIADHLARLDRLIEKVRQEEEREKAEREKAERRTDPS